MSSNLRVANTIKDQLYYLSTNEMMCYGSHNFRGIEESEKSLGSLLFDVQNCTKLKKGTVTIMLNPKDLYNVLVHDSDYIQLEKIEDVYCDMLIDVIHDAIDS